MADYATVQDIQDLKRPLTLDEQTRAANLIPIICSEIRAYARDIGKDFDQMVADDTDLANIAKSVVCNVVIRELNTPGNQLPATSYSEGAGSVSQSYSLPNASGSGYLWPTDKKALGLKRQQISALNLMKPRKGC